MWKIADVVALHKKRSRSNPSNYRPISLLPIVSKLLETVVSKKVRLFLDPKFNDHQFGFRPGRSTIDMLTQLSQNWINAVGRGKEVRAVALDISKAFDKVWHEGLIFKLRNLGISGILLSWFKCYLSGRSQRVCINNSYSSFLPIKAGVPQGSVLGPTLFLVYINDLFDVIENNLDVFADDSTLWAVVPNTKKRVEVADSMNRDLKSIQDWASKWLVTYNHTKTELITFSKKRDMSKFRKNGFHKEGFYLSSPISCPHPPLFFYGSSIPERRKVKLVGLTFSDNLSWKCHILNVYKKCRRSILMLRRAKRALSNDALLVVYKSFVRSVMEYSAPIWMGAGKSYLSKLDDLQSRFINIIGNAYGYSLQSLSHRRFVSGFCIMHRLVHKTAPNSIHNLCPAPITTSNTRRSSRLSTFSNNIDHLTPFSLKGSPPSFLIESLIPKFTTLWNRKLSTDLHCLQPLQAFKTRINSELTF